MFINLRSHLDLLAFCLATAGAAMTDVLGGHSLSGTICWSTTTHQMIEDEHLPTAV
jgi:hypothetical protein